MAPDHVELFKRAVRDNVTMGEARRRVVNERWQAVTPRRASPPESDASEGQRPKFWWDRD
ncbi:hypothetical protein [Sphingomonas paucimobilis]|uniref:Uncharacterized protein n=1 Tax=Sphingomonas paucimobilis TaxID=13689 RepID=A0A7T3A9S5_SPHPI|nr:hypothetical protein [Sphingomonas paucimobilis]QPT08612.1 hypothetical protein I6G38_18145 [Sphingomonas paucimobilis]